VTIEPCHTALALMRALQAAEKLISEDGER
jgi:hypothetical protein